MTRLLVLVVLAVAALGAMAATETNVEHRSSALRTPFLDQLRGGAYDALEAKLEQLQAAYEADMNQEPAIKMATREFARPDPALEPLFDEWVRRTPQSYVARTARGSFRVAMAHAWRGDAWAQDVAPARFDMMSKYLEAAHQDLEAAVGLTAKPMVAIETQMRLLGLVGRTDLIKERLDKAVELDPAAFGPRLQYLHMLQPRWGGSHEAMRAFGKSFAGDLHPKLRVLAKRAEASVLSDQASYAETNRDYVSAVRMYEQANAAYDDDAGILCALGRVYHAVGQTDKAIDLFNRGLDSDPFYAACYFQRSNALFVRKATKAAIADLRTSSELGYVYATQRLGFLFLNGEEGVPIDTAEALRWLEAAAYFWETPSLFALGKTYERGPGVKVDLKRAAEYFRYAANLGYGPAENDLGMLLWYGRGVEADQLEAVQLWRRAAGRGIWQAEHNLEYFLHPIDRYLVKAGIVVRPGQAIVPLYAIGGLLLLLLLVVAVRRRRQASAKSD
jgi:TPR repeat protein